MRELLVRNRVNGIFDVFLQKQRNFCFFKAQEVVHQKVVKLPGTVQIVSGQKKRFLGGVVGFVDQFLWSEPGPEFAKFEPELRRKMRNLFVSHVCKNIQEVLVQFFDVLGLVDLVNKLQIKQSFQIEPRFTFAELVTYELDLFQFVSTHFQLS